MGPNVVADSTSIGRQRVHPLRGREPQLAAVAEELDRVAAGVGGVLIIEGEAGLGKTSLMRAAASHARARGFKTGMATADAGRSSTQMAVFLEAVLGGAEPLVDRRR